MSHLTRYIKHYQSRGKKKSAPETPKRYSLDTGLLFAIFRGFWRRPPFSCLPACLPGCLPAWHVEVGREVGRVSR